MMKKLILYSVVLFIGLFSALPGRGQYSATSITVQDTSGQLWANGTISYVFKPNQSYPSPSSYYFNGSHLSSSYLTPTVVQLDNTASGSWSVPLSTSISPAGSTWTYTVCPNATSPCQIFDVPATSATQNISATINPNLNPIQVSANNNPRAYQDSQISPAPQPGGIYFNALTKKIRMYDGSAYNDIGGGGVTPVGSDYQLQFKLASGLGNTTFSTDAATKSDLTGLRNLKAANVVGAYHASAYATPTPYVSTNGATNLITGACATGGCTIISDPGYPGGNIGDIVHEALPSKLALLDNNINGYSSNFRHDFVDAQNSAAGWSVDGVTEYFRVDKVLNEPPNYNMGAGLGFNLRHDWHFIHMPGYNYGYNSASPTQNGVFNLSYWAFDHLVHSQGIYNFFNANVIKASNGDFNVINFYIKHSSGSRDASAEGVVALRLQINNADNWSLPLTAAIGSDWLVHTNGGGDTGLGAERPLINNQASRYISVNVTSCASTPHPAGAFSCTLAATLPLAWQSSSCSQIPSDIVVHGGTGNTPQSNTNNLRTSMDIPLTSASGLTVGTGFTIIDGGEHTGIHYPETSVITGISGSTITANLSYSHTAGATVCFGGVAGGSVITNNAVSAVAGLWPARIIGSLDSTHIIVEVTRQNSVDNWNVTGPATIYSATTIADTRNPATGATDGAVFRVNDFAPAVAWQSGDSLYSTNDIALQQHMVRLNDGNANPFSHGSFINFIDSGYTGGIGNGAGPGAAFMEEESGANVNQLIDMGGSFFPKAVYRGRGPNGSLYDGFVPMIDWNGTRTLLYVRGYFPGSTYSGSYNIWNHASNGDNFNYTPSTRTLIIAPSTVVFGGIIAATTTNFYGPDSAKSFNSTYGDAAIINHTGGTVSGRWSYDHGSGNFTYDYTNSWSEGGGDGNPTGFKYWRVGMGDGGINTGSVLFSLDNTNKGYFLAPNGCSGTVAGDFSFGCLTGASTALAKINANTGAAFFSALTVGTMNLGITNVQIVMPTSSIAANTCTTPATVTMNGLNTNAAFLVGYASSPIGVNGWGGNGGLELALWPSASNTASYSVCNQTSAAIVPGAMTMNVGAK